MFGMHTRNDGLFILPPYLTRDNVGTYGGMLEALRSNLRYLRRSKQEYLILLTNSETVYNMNFDDALRYHIDNHADMTLIYTKAGNIRFDQQVTDALWTWITAATLSITSPARSSRPTTTSIWMC